MISATGQIAGKSVLVVEDEYLLADDVVCELRRAGAEVIGPAASMPQAMRLIAQTPRLDAVIMDINLRETLAYPLLDRLIDADVPVVISSGYDDATIPERYRHLPRCEKPVSPRQLVTVAAAIWTMRSPAPGPPALPHSRDDPGGSTGMSG